MSNFTIKFSHPWFLLLLIPAIAFTLFPYFRMNKRYRRTRNRITSMILHLTVMVLAIAVLSGITLEYDVPNEETEVILLVDTSNSGKDNADDKDDFVKSVIDNAEDMFKLGIVKFGYDQVYAVELSTDTSDMYAKYLESPSPNNDATDIASALTYASTLFKKKETARIVLLSDALETDGKAINAIKSVSAQGIKVDTVSFPNAEVDDEVQIISLDFPKSKIKVGEKFNVTATLMSTYTGKATITPFDKSDTGEREGTPKEFDLVKGLQTVTIPYTFDIPGLHNISIKLDSDDDTVDLNNTYTSYIDIQSFDKILIIESISDESTSLQAMLNETVREKLSVVNSYDSMNMPTTVNQLRAYDQIILYNVAYKDMPVGFDELLHSYVYDYGGGLFTVCGNEPDPDPTDENWTTNAYTKVDMMGTTYQKLLPVEIIKYTPPAAVVVVIDKSGSMTDSQIGPNGETAFDYAKQGAEATLDALSERDFVAVMSFGDDYEDEISLTPLPYRNEIISAIERIKPGGNTVFTTALKHAGDILSAKTGVEKRHIILITDGQPTDSKAADYLAQAEENAKKGITMSIVGVECFGENANRMTELLVKAGMTGNNLYSVTRDQIPTIPTIIRGDLNVPAIEDIIYKRFQPTFGTTHNITSNINEDEMPYLNGYYGVKAKKDSEVVIYGEYSPIYTQWTYGKGKVGTFACDLNGVWSLDLINSPVGATLINNIVEELFPTHNIHPDEIDSVIEGDNFNTIISIFTDLEDGQYLELTITSPPAAGETEGMVQTIIGNTSGYSRLSFSVITPGLHEILIEKKDADGSTISSSTTYKALGYSKEYDMFRDTEEAEQKMIDLAMFGRGVVIEDPSEVFDNVVKFLHNVINPKILFTILALCLLLLDIAARKFKWKWPHELIANRKAKAKK